MAGQPWRTLRSAGIAAGAAAGLAGAAYAAERLVVAGAKRRPDPDATAPLTPPFDEARRYPSHDGGSLYTISRGEGPVLLFSHGVTLSVRVWVKQFEALPGLGFRCVAFDHRGHGQSTVGSTGHSIDNLAEDVRTLLEGMDLRDVVLVGHSMGGIAVQAFAIRYPDVAAERVRGLVLMSTLAKAPFSGATWLHRVARRGPAGIRILAQPNLGFLLSRIGFGRDPHASHVELAREMIASSDPADGKAAINCLMGCDLSAGVPGIRLPTMILSGSADLLTPPAESRRLAELLPEARLETFEGAGHMLMLERTDEVDQLIADFARDLDAGPWKGRRWPRRPRLRPRRRRGRRRGTVSVGDRDEVAS